MVKIFKKISLVALYIALTTALVLAETAPTMAAVSNPAPSAKISFTFDDGLASSLTQAAPTLSKYGLTGTNYVSTGCVGTTGTCPANPDAQYMTWDQVTQLQNNYGWEIAAHTVNHVKLSTISDAQKDQELSQSKQAFAAHGINATNFATPEGDYDTSALAYIAKYYASHRGFWDQNTNVWPNNDYLLNVMQVQEGVTVAQVKTRIDQAIANKQWLILVLHDIKVSPSTNPIDYEYSTAKLDQIASYVKTKQNAAQLKSVRINEGLVTSDTNMFANSTFDNGIAGGWTTDAPASITKDTGNNGSYPSPANAVKLVGTATNKHLFSPKAAVDPSTTYLFKNFLNVKAITSGSVAFYIDEYGVNDNWVSGQHKVAEASAFVESINFTYKPTSAIVKSVRLQVIVAGNSGITAYLDNVQLFPLSTAPGNLAPGGTFDNGITGGWTTDAPASIVADSSNNGSPSNPQKSVALTATAQNTHLFSPQVAVASTKTYNLSIYVNLKQIVSGEVGFYIDEYNESGAWISGQYKTGVRGVSLGDASHQYIPSSVNVKKARLQMIVTGNSGIKAYVDDVRWYAN